MCAFFLPLLWPTSLPGCSYQHLELRTHTCIHSCLLGNAASVTLQYCGRTGTCSDYVLHYSCSWMTQVNSQSRLSMAYGTSGLKSAHVIMSCTYVVWHGEGMVWRCAPCLTSFNFRAWFNLVHLKLELAAASSNIHVPSWRNTGMSLEEADAVQGDCRMVYSK